ncbi:GtrA family protein [Actinoplanes aureus]|uniref:GtrA family protein n=1 Tax=Actinoplanes aureus TaxID=2792083 RepID=A0A931C3Q2_9ACTN|nr:GtrA family protein [Actinoplanes aureus]MBG0561649.1 GtrA family protein [Actinoplanes aureus]
MPSASTLTERLRRLAPEALAFGIIGAGNALLYMGITLVLLPIGAVKASVVATVVTTTLAYLANRYWTYRNHSRTALRREYTMFFGFNLVGMVIQSGAIAIGKYGFGLTEEHDELLFMTVTVIGIGIATIFRFWAYRTFVFLKPPVDGHEAAITELDATAGLAELSAVDRPGSVARLDLEPELDAR